MYFSCIYLVISSMFSWCKCLLSTQYYSCSCRILPAFAAILFTANQFFKPINLTLAVCCQTHIWYLCKETTLTCHNQQRTWHVGEHWRANTTRTSCCWLRVLVERLSEQSARPAWQGKTCQLHTGKMCMFRGFNSKINALSHQSGWGYNNATVIHWWLEFTIALDDL